MPGATYPGSARQAAVLGALADTYGADPRVRAMCVFGSVGRGDWRADSDLDLDVVVVDDVQVDVERELWGLAIPLARVGEQVALVIPQRADEGDVVLASLLQLSIRYHPLATTNQAILSGLRVLAGPLEQATVEAAAHANQRLAGDETRGRGLPLGLHLAVTAERCLRRGDLWLAIDVLHQARGQLMALFAQSRGGPRPIHTFDAQAPADLQALLSGTLPAADALSVRSALGHLVDLLEHHLPAFAGPGATLSPAERTVLHHLRTRLAGGEPDEPATRAG